MGTVFLDLVNNPDRRFTPDSSRSAAWNCGAYLVQVLGHCAECHTPRNFMMAVNNGRQFAGAPEEGWLAYNITSDPTHGLGGWSDEALTQYLSTGHADGHGPASGPMAEVVEDSLRYLTPDDIHAIVTYLRTVPAQPDGPEAVAANGAPQIDPDGLGARLFAQACEGCHLPNGAGRQSPWASLAGAQSVGDPDGTNIVAILTQGSSLSTSEGTMFMHPFTGAIPTPSWRPSATTRSASSAFARAHHAAADRSGEDASRRAVSSGQRDTVALPRCRRPRTRMIPCRRHALSSDERQEIWIDRVGVGGEHAVREAGIELQGGILQEFDLQLRCALIRHDPDHRLPADRVSARRCSSNRP